MFRSLVSLVLVFSFTFLWNSTDLEAAYLKKIRVLIKEDALKAKVSIKGRYTLKSIPNTKVIFEGENLQEVSFKFYKGFIQIGKARTRLKTLEIVPNNQQGLRFDANHFRGSLIVTAQKNGLNFINKLYLEEYLWGVLPLEAYDSWPKEVLKAQAVVSRTYALYHMNRNKKRWFDVRNDDRNQHYNGKDFESENSKGGVAETKGQILTFKNQVFAAFFHAICGGHTEYAPAIWPAEQTFPQSVKCPYCRTAKKFHWRATITLKELLEKLNAAGHKIKTIQKIYIKKSKRSERISHLIFVSKKHQFVMTAEDFRTLMGSEIIRSTFFEIQVGKKYLRFAGRGWGHGVGFCQMGAYGMTKAHKSMKEILRYYYPGTRLIRY